MQRFMLMIKGCLVGVVFAGVIVSGTVADADIWSGFPIISGGLTGSRNATSGELEGGLVSSNEGNWEEVTLAWYIESQPGEAYPVQFRYNYYIDVNGANSGQDISHVWFTVTKGMFEFIDGADTHSVSDLKVIDLNNGSELLHAELEQFDGNHHVPDTEYALKIDDITGGDRTRLLVSFESYNYPVWGDFYVKGGGGMPGNHFYNAGIGQEVSSPVVSFDSDDTPESIYFGVILGEKDIHFNQVEGGQYKVVTPNGFVPEPGFFAAMVGMGLMGGLIQVVRRKRRAGGVA